jgi:hypothetical protein
VRPAWHCASCHPVCAWPLLQGGIRRVETVTGITLARVFRARSGMLVREYFEPPENMQQHEAVRPGSCMTPRVRMEGVVCLQKCLQTSSGKS